MTSENRPGAPTASAGTLPSVVRPPPLLRWLFRIGGSLLPGLVGGFVVRRMFTPRRRRPKHSVLLASVPQRSLPCGGQSLQYWSWSSPGARGTALLVHGWEGSADDLSAFVPALLQRNFNVVAFDAPAHGCSDGVQTDVHRMAAAIGAVSTAVAVPGAPVRVLVAHSVGAAAAAIHLANGAGDIDRLVMIAPGGELAGDIDRVASALSLPAAAVQAVVARIEAHYGQPLKACSTRLIAGRLRLPTLVVHDRDDAVVPFEEGQALAAAISRARFNATSSLGHRRILRDPGVIAGVAAFCATAGHPAWSGKAA